jgi:hypothetical protein
VKAKSDVIVRLRRRGDRLSKEAADMIEELRATVHRRHSTKTKLGLLRARREGKRIGGSNPESARQAQAASERAEQLRPLMQELAGLSARGAAAEMNRRGIETAAGGKWHAVQVLRLRERLERLTASQ